MKKTLLAAALMAGFAGVAHADTSVTLFVIRVGGIGYQKLKFIEALYQTNTNAGDFSQKRTWM
jgi:predicted porin